MKKFLVVLLALFAFNVFAGPINAALDPSSCNSKPTKDVVANSYLANCAPDYLLNGCTAGSVSIKPVCNAIDVFAACAIQFPVILGLDKLNACGISAVITSGCTAGPDGDARDCCVSRIMDGTGSCTLDEISLDYPSPGEGTSGFEEICHDAGYGPVVI